MIYHTFTTPLPKCKVKKSTYTPQWIVYVDGVPISYHTSWQQALDQANTYIYPYMVIDSYHQHYYT